MYCSYCEKTTQWKNDCPTYRSHVDSCRRASELATTRADRARKQTEDKLADSSDQINALRAKLDALAGEIPEPALTLLGSLMDEVKSNKQIQKDLYNAACTHANNSAKKLQKLQETMVEMSAQIGQLQETISAGFTQQSALTIQATQYMCNQMSMIAAQQTGSLQLQGVPQYALPGASTPMMITSGQNEREIAAATLTDRIGAVDAIYNPHVKTATILDIDRHLSEYLLTMVPSCCGDTELSIGEVLELPNNQFYDNCRNHLIGIYRLYFDKGSDDVKMLAFRRLLAMGECGRVSKRARLQ